MAKTFAIAPRKPPSADEFVSGRPSVQAAKRPSALLTRANGREVRKFTLYFPVDVAKKMRAHCLEAEMDLSEFVTQAVSKAL
jgi:hypothetical protein